MARTPSSSCGSRLRWKEADGETLAYAKLIGHSKEPGLICWRVAESDEAPAEGKEKKARTKEDLMPHVPVKEAIGKEALRSKANGAGIALNRINGFIAELVEEGRLFAWRVKRSRTNAMWMIGRSLPPPEELIKERNRRNERLTQRLARAKSACVAVVRVRPERHTHAPL